MVGGHNRGLVIDRYDCDVNSAWQAVLFHLSLIGYNCEVVLQCFTAIMDIGDVLKLHLDTDI